MKTLKRSFLIAAAAMLNSYCFGQWVKLNAGTNDWLTDIHCVSNDTCYASGYSRIIIKTTDGGQTWNLVNTGIPGTQNQLPAIWCINNNTCLVAGDDMIYKTINGGNNWQTTSFPIGFGGVSDLFFVNDTLGFGTGMGGGDYLKTIDGGDSWTWEDVLISSVPYITIFFINENLGFIGGGAIDASILKTANGGTNWTWSYNDTNYWLVNDLEFVNDSVGFAVGEDSLLIRTVDQGATWVSINPNLNNYYYYRSIECADEDTCYTVGTTILKTTDGGDTWMQDTVGASDALTNGTLYAIHFPTPTVGYAVGRGPTGDKSLILKTDKTTGLNAYNLSLTQIAIYPNPFSDRAKIFYSNANENNPPVFELYDITGRKQIALSLSFGINVLSRNNLPAGLYMYQLKDERQRILTTGKIIIN